MAKIEINLTEHGQGSVKIDGAEIGGVKRIGVSITAGGRNTVRLTMQPENLVIVTNEADIEKEIPLCQA
jgi:hypothetical protein